MLGKATVLSLLVSARVSILLTDLDKSPITSACWEAFHDGEWTWMIFWQSMVGLDSLMATVAKNGIKCFVRPGKFNGPKVLTIGHWKCATWSIQLSDCCSHLSASFSWNRRANLSAKIERVVCRMDHCVHYNINYIGLDHCDLKIFKQSLPNQ